MAQATVREMPPTFSDTEEDMEDKDDSKDNDEMFVSSLDSPSPVTDSATTETDPTPLTSSQEQLPTHSDTMEDLSLQDDLEKPTPEIKADVPEPVEAAAVISLIDDTPAATPLDAAVISLDDDTPATTPASIEDDDDDDIFKSVRIEPVPAAAAVISLDDDKAAVISLDDDKAAVISLDDDKDDIFKSVRIEPVPAAAAVISLDDDKPTTAAVPKAAASSSIFDDDDDDDIFKSARIEPEPAKVSVQLTNGGGDSRATSEEPRDDIPLEDEDENPFEDAHLKPQLQLSGSSPVPATIGHTSAVMNDDDEMAKKEEGNDEFLEICVTSPHKVGEGMSSYMAYKISTKTNLAYFKKKTPVVNRRFSDFLGLHDKLTEKYLQNGRIVPPAPDKNVFAMTKVKMSKEDEKVNESDYVEKRRASLERYLNRTGCHPSLKVDPDFREFLELDAELPKANSTSTLSGKNVMKLFSKVGDKVTNYATKMEETDTWFEDKTMMIENLDTQLKKLLIATESLVEYRRGLAYQSNGLSKSLVVLSGCEDNSKLSAALSQLADLEEKVEKVHEDQAKADFFLLSELVKDYIGITGAVKDVLNERVKAWHAWQSVQASLIKKRENKVRAELAQKQDRVNQLRQEIAETERQLEMAQENFEKISRIIKKEFDLFEIQKCEDFKKTIVKYMEGMLTAQETLVGHWERYLPEVKQIEV